MSISSVHLDQMLFTIINKLWHNSGWTCDHSSQQKSWLVSWHRFSIGLRSGSSFQTRNGPFLNYCGVQDLQFKQLHVSTSYSDMSSLCQSVLSKKEVPFLKLTSSSSKLVAKCFLDKHVMIRRDKD